MTPQPTFAPVKHRAERKGRVSLYWMGKKEWTMGMRRYSLITVRTKKKIYKVRIIQHISKMSAN